MSCEPAASIIAKLGGFQTVSEHLGVARPTVWKWQAPKGNAGTGGVIPLKHHVSLLNLARSKDIPLTAADFLPRQLLEAAE
jgi:hypothetical protein